MPDTSTGSKSSFGFLSKKIGPVPVWLIALLLAGGVYWYENYGPGASSSSSTTSSTATNASGSEGEPVYVSNYTETVSDTASGGSWHYGAPQGLKATPARTTVKLSWDAPAETGGEPRPVSYDVQIDGGTAKTVAAADSGSGGGTISTTMSGLKAGTSYSASVRANGGGGGGNATPATVSFKTTGTKAATSQDAKGSTAAEKASDESKADTSGTTPTGAQSSGRWRTPYTPAATAATSSAAAPTTTRGASITAAKATTAKATTSSTAKSTTPPVKTTTTAKKAASKSKAVTKRPARSGAK